MILLLIAIVFTTFSFGALAKKEYQKDKEERKMIVIAGLTLATIATIFTIISAIISIIIGIQVLTEDHFWWWFH